MHPWRYEHTLRCAAPCWRVLADGLLCSQAQASLEVSTMLFGSCLDRLLFHVVLHASPRESSQQQQTTCLYSLAPASIC